MENDIEFKQSDLQWLGLLFLSFSLTTMQLPTMCNGVTH